MASFAPTADLRSGRAYGVPYESNPQGVCFLLHRGSSTEASQSLYKSEKGRNPTFPHDIRKTAAKNTEGPSPRKSPGAGSLLFIREKPSPLFSISQWLPCSASRDVQRLTRTRGVFRAYGGNHGGKPQLWRVPLRKGNPTEAISQSSRHNAS